jgi:FKBP-type peptidyl-prolyl cis-trans isomerase
MNAVPRPAAALLAAALLLLAACGAAPDAPPAKDGTVGLEQPKDLGQADTAFALAFAIDLPQFDLRPSGLYVRELDGGRGGAGVRPGNTVALRYSGFLANGREFDGSARNGRLLRFTVGQHRVIEGLEEGIRGMEVGARRRLIIPPALAYGRAGQPGVIPSRATLVFDVELVELR